MTAIPHEGNVASPAAGILPSQNRAAKLAGFLYVLQMATGICGFVIRGMFTGKGDAAQTAQNIASADSVFRFGVALDVITSALVVILAWAIYVVLERVNRNGALLALILRLVENATILVAVVSSFTALRLLSGRSLGALEPAQLEGLARAFIGMHGSIQNIGFVFTGLGSAVFSYVWLKSRYIPKSLAWLGIIGSSILGSMSLITMIFPRVWEVMGLSYMMPMFFYEVGLGLWLMFKGVKDPAR